MQQLHLTPVQVRGRYIAARIEFGLARRIIPAQNDCRVDNRAGDKVGIPNNADIMSPTSIVARNDRPNPGGHSIVYSVVGLLTHRLRRSLPSRPLAAFDKKQLEQWPSLEEALIATIRLRRFTAAGPSRNRLEVFEGSPKFPVRESLEIPKLATTNA